MNKYYFDLNIIITALDYLLIDLKWCLYELKESLNNLLSRQLILV